LEFKLICNTMNGFTLGFKDEKLKELINFRVKKKVFKELKQEAEKKGINLSDLIREKIGDKNDE